MTILKNEIPATNGAIHILHNNDTTKDGFETGEIENKVQPREKIKPIPAEAFEASANDNNTTDRLVAYDVLEFMTKERKQREMYMSPFLPSQGYAIISAKCGIGKTNLSLQIAYTLATGGSMFCDKFRSNVPVAVLFVDGEMHDAEMKKRISNIMNMRGTNPDYIPGFLRIFSTNDQIDNYGVPIPTPDLGTKEGQKRMESLFGDAKVIILDNISCLAPSILENDSSSWSSFLEWVIMWRRKGITMLVVMHEGKASSGKGPRGASKITDAADTVISLSHPINYLASDGCRFNLNFTKARGFYGIEAAPFEARLIPSGDYSEWEISEIIEEGEQLFSRVKADDPRLARAYEIISSGGSDKELSKEFGISTGYSTQKLKKDAIKKFGAINQA